MANKTDVVALHKRGSDPQLLVHKMTRHSIYSSFIWNHNLFGVNVADLVGICVGLNHIGGTYGTTPTPTPFLCMLLKLLQLSPDTAEIQEYLIQKEFKYPRVLAAFYIRLVETPVNVYKLLEPLLADFRRVVVRTNGGVGEVSNEAFAISHVDVVVDGLLSGIELFGITLPRIPPRPLLMETGQLEKRVSTLAL